MCESSAGREEKEKEKMEACVYLFCSTHGSYSTQQITMTTSTVLLTLRTMRR